MRMMVACVAMLVGMATADVGAAGVGSGSLNPGGGLLDLQPGVNEVSLYRNFLDDGDNAGQTLQVVSINSLKLKYWFDLEVTLDVNHHMNRALDPAAPEPEEYDYYLELGLVRSLRGRWKLNYQRIHGTFMSEPVNQLGLRAAF